MKNNLFTICNIVFFIILLVTSCKTTKELHLYKEYYKITENLLDDIDNKYHWTDGIDSYDYYDSIHKIRMINK